MHKGATRLVFPLFSVVIKVPRPYSVRTFLNGMPANMQERELWKAFHSPMLARVYYADILGLVLVMARADKVCSNCNRGLRTFFAKCEANCLPADPRPDNIGIFKDGKKLIDYGS